jgi:hypothetical protein
LIDKPQTIEDLKWNNYFKEVLSYGPKLVTA